MGSENVAVNSSALSNCEDNRVKDKSITYEHLVIGGGVAGLSAALMLAERSPGRVCVVCKGKAEICNSRLAQGGIACVLDKSDTFDEHIADTLAAGDHLCNAVNVRGIVEAGPEKIQWLMDLGTHFTTRGEIGENNEENKRDEFHLGREGGHHKRRVIHAGDITGEEVHNTLIAAARANPKIDILEEHSAIDLITSWRLGWMGGNHCLGAYVLDIRTGFVKTIVADTVTVATGGCGKVYLYTSNSEAACGSGVAMCYRAHVPIANMEFLQFHPTLLYHPKVNSFLISEALRGEGGILKVRDTSGKLVSFMEKYHEMASLAPRDVVARAIDNELKVRGLNCAYLDMTSLDREFLEKRFPKIFAQCLEAGIDMSRQPIPVVPAAHYCCGGIQATVDGRTNVKGLSAVGECACTGLHGANRLASNSLMEALVCARLTAKRLGVHPVKLDRKVAIPAWKTGKAVAPDEAVLVAHMWDEIRRLMWDYVGIVRTDKRLARALRRLRTLRREIHDYYFRYLVTPDTLELRNLAVCAELIVKSAQKRKESRGLHYTLDYPETSEKIASTVLPGYRGR